MNVLVLGLSHKTARVEQREKAALPDHEARAVLRDLSAHPDVAEAVALSTCNRTELYAAATDAGAAEQALAAALIAHSHISGDELACARYVLRDERAAAQLFRVTSSLDSMVVGESEIQGQVRAAWETAREEETAGPLLNQLFRQALEVGKQVRAQTRIGTGSSSVCAVAVDLAREVFDDLHARQVLVIGAGRMAEGTAKALVHQGVGAVVVANRTVGTARELASRVGGRGVGFPELRAELAAADIVISSTDAPHAILQREHVEDAVSRRGGRPMVMVDISVPRDLDPAIADVPGVLLYDIDDLERVVEANLNGRRMEAQRGERFIGGAVAEYSAWRFGRAATPAIAELRERAEEIRRDELARVAGQWDSISEADLERLNAVTRGIVNKLLHEPTVRVREAASEGDGLHHLESLRHLFGLERRAADVGDAAGEPHDAAGEPHDAAGEPHDAAGEPHEAGTRRR